MNDKKITDRQRDLMKHACAWDGLAFGGHRNFFSADQGSEDDLEWAALVERGMARVRRNPYYEFLSQ